MKLPNDLVRTLRERQPQCVQLGLHKVLLVLNDHQLCAMSPLCPHAGASLEGGFIDAKGSLVCPLHHYRFDVRNGFNRSGEGYKLKTYPIRKEGDHYFIFLEEQQNIS